MNLTKLMSLAEASGFAGGSAGYVDEYPSMSLSECSAALPMFIMESQANGFDETRRHNDLIVEAVAEAMNSGSPINESTMNALNEGALDTIKSKVSAFFEKIRKFIQSIIAKLNVFIDRMRMTGQQLWAKYGKDKDLQNTEKLKSLTFDGYKFGEASFNSAEFDNPQGAPNLVKKAYGDDAVLPEKAMGKLMTAISDPNKKNPQQEGESKEDAYDRRGTEALDAMIEKLGDLTSAERASKMAVALTGKNNLGDDWAEALRKELWGDKFTFTYGGDGFDVATVGKTLSNPVNLDAIRDEYKKLEKAVGDYEKSLKNELDTYTKNLGSSESAYDKTRLAKATAYFNKYMEAIKDAYAVITGVKKVRSDYEQAKYKQARNMFSKMIGAAKAGGKKETDTNDVEVDDDLIFDAEI